MKKLWSKVGKFQTDVSERKDMHGKKRPIKVGLAKTLEAHTVKITSRSRTL